MNVIALDIDGPLNSHRDHRNIEDFVERDKITDQRVCFTERNLHWFQSEMGVKFFDSRGNGFKGGHGDFVSVEIAERLAKLCRETDSVVLGVSSWFGFTARLTQTEYNNRIAKFLDVPIVETAPSTSGGLSRVLGLAKWCLINQPERLVVLDDQRYDYWNYGFGKVKPDIGRDGMCEEVYEQAKALLTGPQMIFKPVGRGVHIEFMETSKW